MATITDGPAAGDDGCRSNECIPLATVCESVRGFEAGERNVPTLRATGLAVGRGEADRAASRELRNGPILFRFAQASGRHSELMISAWKLSSSPLLSVSQMTRSLPQILAGGSVEEAWVVRVDQQCAQAFNYLQPSGQLAP